jgi:hypothetical protein
MPFKKHKPEEIIHKLREAEMVLVQSASTAEACRRIRSIHTWHHLISQRPARRMLGCVKPSNFRLPLDCDITTPDPVADIRAVSERRPKLAESGQSAFNGWQRVIAIQRSAH